jgi:hypothetical protein
VIRALRRLGRWLVGRLGRRVEPENAAGGALAAVTELAAARSALSEDLKPGLPSDELLLSPSDEPGPSPRAQVRIMLADGTVAKPSGGDSKLLRHIEYLAENLFSDRNSRS